MRREIKKLPKSEVEIEVTLPFTEFEPYLKKAAALISEKTEIEGFRRGKAPYDIVRSRVGENKIYEEAAEVAVRETYKKIVAELAEGHTLGMPSTDSSSMGKIIPIGKPEITITKLALGNEFQYKVKVAFLPEVKLPDYQKIAEKVLYRETEVVEVTEEEIAKTIEWLRESRAKLITVNRPAGPGDRVEIDFETRHGGVKVEGGESRNHPVVIGRGKFLPGFEEALIGLEAGDEKDFTLTVPENWREKSLAGKLLDFHVKMLLVQERNVPEMNDEFAKSLGNFSSAEALKQSVKEGLLAEKEEKEKQRIRSLMIEEIAQNTEVEVPEVLIERELDKMTEELKSGVQSIGMKWADYLLHIKKSAEELRLEWRKEAEKRVKIALVLQEIANQEKIEPTEEEIEARANQYLAQFKTAEEAEKAVDAASLREYTKGVLRNEKVFELLENLESRI